MQISQLGRAPDEVLVEPLELLDLVHQPVHEPLVQLAEIDAGLALLDVLALAVQELLHLLGERVDVDRLLDVAVAAGHQGALTIAFHRVGGDRDDRGVGEGRERLDHRHHLVAVDGRQVHVQQDQRRLLADGGLDPGQSVLGVDDRVPLRLEDGADQHAVLAVVLDVEDLGLLGVATTDRHASSFTSGPR